MTGVPRRIGVFEIEERLGAGGMGEVYRARDTRLGRSVAIKLLPDAVRNDPDRTARFEREARVLASLNHPHIGTIHGLERAGDVDALVMELVEGDDLSDLIGSGGMPIDRGLTIAQQMASALEAAHEQGVIHRDLKPSNVKVRRDGSVKVLDFGLAKVMAPGPGDPTLTEGATQAGRALGTPAYMSPEQARGEPTGPQADIWSFGVVLYELLTGISPFRGQTVAETLAHVLTVQPDLSTLPSGTPAMARHVLRRCLEKDKSRRLQHMGDVRIAIEEALAASQAEAGASHAARASRRRGAWTLAAIFGVTSAALLGVVVYQRDARSARTLVPFHVLPPEGGGFLTPVISGASASVGGTVSPDGRMLAFTARDGTGRIRLWVRPMDSLVARALPGTDAAALPFWSPDSKALGFFSGGRLKRIDATGDAPQVLCQASRGRGGTWNRDGVIVFAGFETGLSRVNAAGGEKPQAVTKLAAGQQSHRFPHFLPDGRHFLYYAEGSGEDDTGVFVGDLQGDSQRVLAADSAAVLAPPDHLLFVRQGTLFAQRFDVVRLEATGDPIPLADSVPHEGASPAFSASHTGVLTYGTGPINAHQQYTWLDRGGRPIETVGPPGDYRGVDLSPRDTRIAVHRHVPAGGDIWVLEARGTETRVTFDAADDDFSPVWSPDATTIAFGGLRTGRWGLYLASADGTGAIERLLDSDSPLMPSAWSRDSIVYWALGGKTDHWLLTLAGGRRRSVPLLDSRFAETHGQVSPDGKWLAYMSSASGRGEIYVRRFPDGQRSWLVSKGGGVMPRWSGNSRELFYATSYDDGTLMAVEVREADSTLVPVDPVELFRLGIIVPPHVTVAPMYHPYAVSRDGLRFLVPRPAAPSGPIAVVLDWTALLDR